MIRTVLAAGLAMAMVMTISAAARAAYIEQEFKEPPPARKGDVVRPRPPLPPEPIARNHVPELATTLDRLEIRRPLVCGRLVVYPLAIRGGAGGPGGTWWTMDAALAKGVLTVSERGDGGTVPFVVMENSSRSDHVFIMAGEVISGGKQTRTVRQDVILAPGQRADVPVFCVEQHRWKGEAAFSGAGLLVPQSVQKEMRKGADQAAVWSEVGRANAALSVAPATGTIEAGYKSAPVQRELDEVRRAILPEAPADAVGYIFADRHAGRALGIELFGRTDLAQALLGKLIDAYAVDLVVPMRERSDSRLRHRPPDDDLARAFLERLRRAGSDRGDTPSSGAGIRLRAADLVGGGVSIDGRLVHFGCQAEERMVPMPMPEPR